MMAVVYGVCIEHITFPARLIKFSILQKDMGGMKMEALLPNCGLYTSVLFNLMVVYFYVWNFTHEGLKIQITLCWNLESMF